MTDGSFDADRAAAAADWRGWPALPERERTDDPPVLVHTHTNRNRSMNDDVERLASEVEKRIRTATAEAEDAIAIATVSAQNEVKRMARRTTVEAGRFDRRVEALTPWQTVAAAIALLFIGALFGAGVALADEPALAPDDYGCPTGWIDADTGAPFDVQAFLATDPRPDVVLECPETAQDGADAAGDDG